MHRLPILAVLTVVALLAWAVVANAAIIKVGDCDYWESTNASNSTISIDGYKFHNARYWHPTLENAADYWHYNIYRPLAAIGQYKACRVVTSVSVPVVVSGTVGGP